MRALRLFAVAAICAAVLLYARPATSYPTTTTLGGLVTVGGTVVVVLYVMKAGPFAEADAGTVKPKAASTRPSTMALLHLKELGPSVTQDLAQGQGPVINDWAAALKLSPERRLAFGALLHRNRAELIELSRTEVLTEERADRFFQRVVELLEGDPVLSGDVRALRQGQG